MFDVDTFIAECREAVAENEPRLAVRDVLGRALSNRSAVAAALPAERAELTPLYNSADLTIMKIVWAPGMRIPPHDHLMWACNGIYSGGERNHLFRRSEGTIVESGGLDLGEGEIGLLGHDTIHSVTNMKSHEFTAAIHVYGGDYVSTRRSIWDSETLEEGPADGETIRMLFEEANAAL